MTVRALAVASLLVLALSGCTGDDPQPDPVPAPTGPAAASSAAPQRLAPGQSAKLPTVTVTVSDVKQVKPPEGWSNPQIVIATVLVEATGGTTTYAAREFSLVGADGQRYEPHTIASAQGLPLQPLGSGSVAAPDKAKGLITFDSPGTLSGSRIEYQPSGGDLVAWAVP